MILDHVLDFQRLNTDRLVFADRPRLELVQEITASISDTGMYSGYLFARLLPMVEPHCLVKLGERLENGDDHRHDVLMQQEHQELMDASNQFCPNAACPARGQRGPGTIRIHDRKRQRYRCTVCKQTFSQRRGTMFEGLRKPVELIIIVVTRLSYGCPVQAIVHAFGLDERAVASWRDRAGAQYEQVHQVLVETGKLDLVHVQADEIRVKGRNMIAWMGVAMMVSTRLWLAGAVRVSRDKG